MMKTSEPVALQTLGEEDLLSADENAPSKVDEALMQVVRNHAVVVELMDDRTEDGKLQVVIHSDNDAARNAAVEELKEL